MRLTTVKKEANLDALADRLYANLARFAQARRGRPGQGNPSSPRRACVPAWW
jgi:hypothetical protein